MRNEAQTTYHLGLIGWPLQQSLSPLLHQAALKAYRLAGEYQLFPFPPFPEGEARGRELLQRLRSQQLHGLNVTLPHKQTIMSLLDEVTPHATAIGAVNTLYCRDGRLVGDNTDAAGFWNDLTRLGLAKGSGQSAGALVLGAGGAARAVVYALARAGWDVSVIARRVEQALELVSSLGFTQARAIPFALDDLSVHLSDITTLTAGVDSYLVINATPLGSRVHPELSPWPKDFPFPHNAFLYDLVSYPAVTPFMQQGLASGRSGYNGLGMLVEQAALAFEIWSGRDAPLQVMREAVAINEN